MIITIGRQYGSGGRVLGEKLAQKLGYKFYDQELSNLEEQYGNNTKKNETNQDGRRDTK